MHTLREFEQKPEIEFKLNWGPWVLPSVNLIPGSMVLVVGGTGVGKSTFALNLLLQLGTPGVLYSLDTDLITQGTRAVSIITGLPEEHIRSTLGGWTRVLDRHAPWLRAYRDLGMKPQELEGVLKAEEELWGQMPTCMVVDNVADVAGTTGYESFTDTFNKLKDLAQKYRVILIVLNHVGKNATGRITLSDSLYAGPNRASLVLGLTREGSGIWCSVLKNRHGEADSQGNYGIHLRFDPQKNMRMK